MSCFITFEGTDGSGKTTQAELLADAFTQVGQEFELLREPGGVVLSETIRTLLLDPATKGICATAELLLYEAARAQLTFERIIPALIKGTFVICDRYADSTLAYQASGRGLDVEEVETANTLGTLGMKPNITFLLDMPASESFARIKGGTPDRLEAEGVAFQEKVRAGYLRAAETDPKRFVVLDARKSIREIHHEVVETLKERALCLKL